MSSAFKAFPWAANWTVDGPVVPDGFRVAIIGSGLCGVAMAVQLELLGIPYTVLERRAGLGGTWNINRYPDIRVDSASISCEFSFEKGYRWSEYFARGEEVRRYLEHIANKYGVSPNPQWIAPRANYGRVVEPEVRWLLDNFPGYWNWFRYLGAPPFGIYEIFVVDEEWKAKGGLVNEMSDSLRAELIDYITDQVGGRQDLIDKLTPSYAPMIRRPVVDNGWYQALTRENVELVTSPITRLTGTGIGIVDGDVRDTAWPGLLIFGALSTSCRWRPREQEMDNRPIRFGGPALSRCGRWLGHRQGYRQAASKLARGPHPRRRRVSMSLGNSGTGERTPTPSGHVRTVGAWGRGSRVSGADRGAR
jgi:cation diffusion facilitator CzcD-associated flavoprotein CzcO